MGASIKPNDLMIFTRFPFHFGGGPSKKIVTLRGGRKGGDIKRGVHHVNRPRQILPRPKAPAEVNRLPLGPLALGAGEPLEALSAGRLSHLPKEPGNTRFTFCDLDELLKRGTPKGQKGRLWATGLLVGIESTKQHGNRVALNNWA